LQGKQPFYFLGSKHHERQEQRLVQVLQQSGEQNIDPAAGRTPSLDRDPIQ